MHKEFPGHSFALEQSIETREIRLLFEDSWYWLHYCFFNCRDSILSENSPALRTHLYNLAACLYRSYEEFKASPFVDSENLDLMISELVEIAEYSRSFPICIWSYGDSISAEAVLQTIKALPGDDQIGKLLSLPHFSRLERERLHYQYLSEESALKRFRTELGNFNKRKKDERKNQQRAGQDGAAPPIPEK